jgi:predicted enzyme related to lactoylglutathione lyase
MRSDQAQQSAPSNPVLQLRLVVEAEDFEEAVSFFRDVLGLPEEVAPRLRVAFEVADSRQATSELVAAGATLVAPPVETPWRSLNSRLDAPAGLHITLFQELESTKGAP